MAKPAWAPTLAANTVAKPTWALKRFVTKIYGKLNGVESLRITRLIKTGAAMAVATSRTDSAGLDLQAMIHHYVMPAG